MSREQFVSVNGTDSRKSPIVYGVPQGSILGPLLFIIYINDIPEISKHAKMVLYADDANIIITGANMDEIQVKVSELASNLLNWVQCNGLALNLKKTYYMVFTNRRINTDIELRINNIVIKRVTETRFLGVLIDEKLTWKSHISAMRAKMSRYVGIMYKLKGILPLKVRLQIYHSFVQSHLNYCSLVWGFSAKANIEKLFSSQKKGYAQLCLPILVFFRLFNILIR